MARGVAGDGQRANGEQVCAQQPPKAANHRLEHLHLAVDVKSTAAQAHARGARTPISVLLDQGGHAVLEVPQSLRPGIAVIGGRRGKDGQGRETVDKREGVVAQDIVQLDVTGVLAVSRERDAGNRAELGRAGQRV